MALNLLVLPILAHRHGRFEPAIDELSRIGMSVLMIMR